MTLSLVLLALLKALIYVVVAAYPAMEVLLLVREYLTKNVYTYRTKRNILAVSTLSIFAALIALVYFTIPAAGAIATVLAL